MKIFTHVQELTRSFRAGVTTSSFITFDSLAFSAEGVDVDVEFAAQLDNNINKEAIKRFFIMFQLMVKEVSVMKIRWWMKGSVNEFLVAWGRIELPTYGL